MTKKFFISLLILTALTFNVTAYAHSILVKTYNSNRYPPVIFTYDYQDSVTQATHTVNTGLDQSIYENLHLLKFSLTSTEGRTLSLEPLEGCQTIWNQPLDYMHTITFMILRKYSDPHRYMLICNYN